MAFFLRTTSFPPLTQITAVPQIVVIDLTGPAIVFGTKPGACCLVAEFTAGAFSPTEVTSDQQTKALYSGNGKIYPYFAQVGGIQNGNNAGATSGITYEGAGLLQLLGKSFQRLILVRVDHEAVTTDGGTTKGQLSVTVTVNANDQDGASHTNKDIVIPAGYRMGSANTFAGSTRVFATSGNFTIPKGTTLTANAVTVLINCFPIVVIEPVVATAIAAIAFVLDSVLPNVDPGTTITAVNNSTALWPNGTGTTLAARIASQYPAAINTTLPNQTPASDIVVVWAARRTVAIRQALANNANNSSSIGRGRVACVSAQPAASTSAVDAAAGITAAIGLAGSDNYAQPADRVIITFPQHQIVVDDFGGIAVTINADGAMACTLSNFPEEMNPGASNAFIQFITAMEASYVLNPLAKGDYANLIAAGVCALYFDRAAGWQFMQGVTAANSTNFPTRVPIKRRRMADFIEDTLADIASPYLKQPATDDRQRAFVMEVETFLESLKATNTPASQRIVDYKVDDVSGNTPDQLALGIFVVKVFVKLLASMDYIVYIATIGETVTIPTSVAAAA